MFTIFFSVYLFPPFISFSSYVARFPAACKTEAKWMFSHLDLSNDGFLSTQEMYDLEHDQNERCIKPFLDTCDLDQDNTITPREWCRCFEKTDRPCTAVRRRIGNDLLGRFFLLFIYRDESKIVNIFDLGDCGVGVESSPSLWSIQ